MTSLLAKRLIPLGLGTIVGGAIIFAMRPTNKNNEHIAEGGLFISNDKSKVKVTDTELIVSNGKIQVELTGGGLKIFKPENNKSKNSLFEKYTYSYPNHPPS